MIFRKKPERVKINQVYMDRFENRYLVVGRTDTGYDIILLKRGFKSNLYYDWMNKHNGFRTNVHNAMDIATVDEHGFPNKFEYLGTFEEVYQSKV